MAGGCNAGGVSGSAGVGHDVVLSITDDEPDDYLRSLSPDRFTETQWAWETAKSDSAKICSQYYALGAEG